VTGEQEELLRVRAEERRREADEEREMGDWIYAHGSPILKRGFLQLRSSLLVRQVYQKERAEHEAQARGRK
jgi:hypothetical protein